MTHNQRQRISGGTPKIKHSISLRALQAPRGKVGQGLIIQPRSTAALIGMIQGYMYKKYSGSNG